MHKNENVVYTHSALKTNEVMKFAGKLRKLENIMLNNLTQTQKDKHHMMFS